MEGMPPDGGWPLRVRTSRGTGMGMPARERLTTGMPIRGSVARRAVFGASLALIFAVIWCSATAHRVSALGDTRTLSMFNIHTKESLTVTFKRDGKYDQD